MKTEDTEVLGRELNSARSKPDTVDRPVRTARIFVHHYNSTQYCKTETVFLYVECKNDADGKALYDDERRWKQKRCVKKRKQVMIDM